MAASVFTVSRTQLGWLVCEDDRVADIFSSQHWALKGADALAYQRQTGTGDPTMVVMRYSGGASVVACRYG